MKTVRDRLLLLVALSLLLAVWVMPTALAQNPGGWTKMTGVKTGYSGVPDGIMPDCNTSGLPTIIHGRENSYAWSMEVMDGFLYVGTSRNVLGPMVQMLGGTAANWPQDFPMPCDMRGRLFRMNLRTRQWSHVYTCDPAYMPDMPMMGNDLGYRMMRAYTAPGTSSPVLYVGGSGLNSCRMLAVEKTGRVTPVFTTSAGGAMRQLSVRAITKHGGELFWASEDDNGMVIYHCANPLWLHQVLPHAQFQQIRVPSYWFPEGGEIWDMISYNGFLYVFLSAHGDKDTGFWCARLESWYGKWKWKIIVGNKALGARYEPGMGRALNGAGVPCLFGNKVYVATMAGTMIRMTGDLSGGGAPPIDQLSQPVGQQIFRFGANDLWERVMPPARITNPTFVEMINGFANPLNAYMWRLVVNKDKLYVGTFDIRTLLESIQPLVPQIPDVNSPNPAGFDLYYTTDGDSWYPESLGGFGDRWNYGVRSLVVDPATNDLYLGTANPFYGCQVWRKSGYY